MEYSCDNQHLSIDDKNKALIMKKTLELDIPIRGLFFSIIPPPLLKDLGKKKLSIHDTA